MAINDRSDDMRVFIRVILQISILNNDNISLHMLKSRPQGSTFTLIGFVKKDFYIIVGKVFQDLAGAVSGIIINNDNFLLYGNIVNPGD